MNKRKKVQMWAVMGRGGGIFALAFSAWKARDIRDECFNVGVKTNPEIVSVIVEFQNSPRLSKRIKSLANEISGLQSKLARLKQTIDTIEEI